MSPQVPMKEICERYKKLYSGAIYDVMEEMGYPDQALAPDLRPLDPDSVLAGPAFTVKGIPDPTADPELREKRITLFKAMSDPCIDVRDCSFDTRVAHYGEMNATLGLKYGCTGAVVDGGVRDSGFLKKMKFPVFSRFHTPVEALGRWSYYKWQVPINMRGILNKVVVVNPGDFVFGDIDGVIIVPKEVTLEVLVKTEKMVNTENNARQEYIEGDPEEVYSKYKRL